MKMNYEEELNEQKADELLQNVFRAAGREPNTTPIGELTNKRENKLKSLKNARILAMCLLVLVLISPVAFRNSLLNELGRPEVTDDVLAAGNLTLFLRDTGSGIDYEGIVAKTKEGRTILPSACSQKTATVTFRVPEDGSDLSIFIPSKTGGTAHLHFSATRSLLTSNTLSDFLFPAIRKK